MSGGIVLATTMVGVRPRAGDHRFFIVTAFLMAAIVVSGFSLQLAMGRSTFRAPLLLHAHALVFFGWTTFYVLQVALAGTQSRTLHRRLGWVGAGWAALMVVLGTVMTVGMIRRGATPFFFQPAYFLVMNVMSVVTFAGLVAAGIALRRRTAWHRRLLFCGMAVVIGPAFGRLLPMPLLVPHAGWAVFAALMLLPSAGLVADLRRRGRVHPAWWWGMGTITAAQVATSLIAFSPLGLSLYQVATAGAPGARVAPYAFPPPPAGPAVGQSVGASEAR